MQFCLCPSFHSDVHAPFLPDFLLEWEVISFVLKLPVFWMLIPVFQIAMWPLLRLGDAGAQSNYNLTLPSLLYCL